MLRRELQELTDAIGALADTIGKATALPRAELLEGLEMTAAPDQDMEISMTAQAAVATLKEICKGAEDCSKDGCLLHDWCSEQLPDARPAKAPQHWPLP